MSRFAVGVHRLLGVAAMPTATLAALVTLSSCGLPGDGSPQAVDDDAVPYRLLDPDGSSAPSPGLTGRPGAVPVVFWTDGEQLVPEATGHRCSDAPDTLVTELLRRLAAGPSEGARALGRSSVVPPDAGLQLVEVAEGRATLQIETESSLSAEQLPVAVGQIVLTITSAPGVDSVEFVTDDEALSVPLPGGALTEDPLTAADYTSLLPARTRAGRVGCASG